jgi:photosystem II stability/assembly factor-like uncharacterized protein
VTTNGGKTWRNRSSADDVVLYGVKLHDSGRGWAAGEKGAVFFIMERAIA